MGPIWRPTHPTPGIEPGSQIEMCDYSMSSASETLTLDTFPRCWELFGAMKDIKIHRVFDTQCPQGSKGPLPTTFLKTITFFKYISFEKV